MTVESDRAQRIARLEEIVGDGGDDQTPSITQRIVRLEERVAHLGRSVERYTRELVEQAGALRALGLVPCLSCSRWSRVDDDIAGIDSGGGTWHCAQHVAELAKLNPGAPTVERIAAWLARNHRDLPAGVLAETIAANHAVETAFLAHLETVAAS